MKFTSLRLTGFKSFVEPSELLIEEGLTGIVGPNGCGKSNLVEALRWVMGETSYKSMRASAMEDVIFGGSSSRPARNTAEVVLRLDEIEGKAPAGFTEFEQLEVSRRITRDTGSVYRLNGRDVRARDVQLLFADASTGAHSTSLVAQGKVAELIAAKPQARRAILEEAAGISGLYSRRHEAELRLKATETNLARVGDTINLLENQLESLKRQARQARRYKAISEDVRKLEALLAHLRVEAASQAVEEGETTLHEAAKATREATIKASQAANALTSLQERTPALREEEAKSAAKLQHLKVTQARLEDEAKQLVLRADQLRQQIAQAEADFEREVGLAEETIRMKAELAEEHARLKAEEAGEADEVARADAAHKAVEAALREEEAALNAIRAEVASADARRAALTREAQAAENRLQKVKADQANAAREADALKAAMAGLPDIAAHEAALVAAEEKLSAASKAVEEARTAEEAARGSLREARRADEESRKTLDRLETEIRTIERLLTPRQISAYPPIIDSVHAKPGFERALTAALGDDLDGSLHEGAASTWRKLDVATLGPLPEGAAPLTEAVEAPPALVARLSQTGVVAREDGPRLQPLLKQGQRLVSPEGDVWRWDGFSSSADTPSAAAQRLAERNRLQDLIRQRQAATSAAEETTGAMRRQQANVQMAEGRRTQAEQAERAARKEMDSGRDALARARAEAGRFEARIEAQRANEARLARDLEGAETEAAAARQALDGLPPIDDLRARVTELDGRLAIKRAESAELRATARSLAQTRDMRTARLNQIERDLKHWEARASQASVQQDALKKRAAALTNELAEVEKLPAQIAIKQDYLRLEVEKAEGERREAADALAGHEVKLADAAREEKAAETALAEARRSEAVLTERLDGAKARLRDLHAAIEEALDMTAEEIARQIGAELENLGEVPPIEQLQAELDRLKAERGRLGAVNLRADAEMEEAQGQLDSLSKERGELEEAIARLRGAISKLNQEGRERLLASFDEVNRHFKELFSTLFSGGEAELHLTESDDPLEAGLEIIARPPGKKPQILTLLSGGEQALTATALIFAVFLTNPAPICVLDEVDAPLDDSNVERLCNMLNHVQGLTGTRFLVITHHPLTMSRMNRLYGVTMAERGVSKLVSVDLAEAEALREAG